LAHSSWDTLYTCSRPEPLSCFQSNSGTINFKENPSFCSTHCSSTTATKPFRQFTKHRTRQFLAFSAPLRFLYRLSGIIALIPNKKSRIFLPLVLLFLSTLLLTVVGLLCIGLLFLSVFLLLHVYCCTMCVLLSYIL